LRVLLLLLLLLLLQLTLLHLLHNLLGGADRTVRAKAWLIVLHLRLWLTLLGLGQLRLFFRWRLVLRDVLVGILLGLALTTIHSILGIGGGS
jgi:hypothetical protein